MSNETKGRVRYLTRPPSTVSWSCCPFKKQTAAQAETFHFCPFVPELQHLNHFTQRYDVTVTPTFDPSDRKCHQCIFLSYEACYVKSCQWMDSWVMAKKPVLWGHRDLWPSKAERTLNSLQSLSLMSVTSSCAVSLSFLQCHHLYENMLTLSVASES